jgi:hypothetical protein
MPDRGERSSPPPHPTAVLALKHHLTTFLVLLASGENNDHGDREVGKCVGEDSGVGCCCGCGGDEMSEGLVAPFFMALVAFILHCGSASWCYGGGQTEQH